jgi:hypothetical protein
VKPKHLFRLLRPGRFGLTLEFGLLHGIPLVPLGAPCPIHGRQQTTCRTETPPNPQFPRIAEAPMTGH